MDGNANRKRVLRKVAFAAVGVVFSVVGLVYVFKGVRIDDLTDSVRRVEWLPLVGSVTIYWAGTILLRAFLVRHLLRSAGEVRVGVAYRCICVGFLGNNVLPLKAGEVVRAAAIHRSTGLEFPAVVGGLAVERMLDLAMLAILAFVAIQLAPVSDRIRDAAFVATFVFALGSGILIFVGRRKWKDTTEDNMGRTGRFVWQLWVKFSKGLGALGSFRGILIAVLLAAGLWGAALGTIMLRLDSFGLPATFPYTVVLLTSLGLGVAVPSAPGYAGVYHAAAGFALELFGVDHTTAVAFALYSWVLDIGLSSVAGAISLTTLGAKLGELNAAPRQGE